jgi:type IV secretory pathway VirB9-like protein
MRFFTAILLASVSLAGLWDVARADDAGQLSEIRVVAYSPLRRTDIIGIVGQPTTITFPRGEAIYRVVQTGKPDKDGNLADAGWQGASPEQVKDTPLGNNLTLWPVVPGQSTMTVITLSTEGEQKVYPFRLVAVADDTAALVEQNVTLNLIFSGTAKARPAIPTLSIKPGAPLPVAAIPARHNRQNELEAAKEKLRKEAFNGSDGACHYIAKGQKPTTIEPRCPMDNGQWTLMRFPGLSKKPAVYVVTGEDDERLARQHADGDFVVVEEIAQHFRLRLGPDVLDILNQAYDPAGKPAGTGTITPGVERDLIQVRR